MPYVHSNLDEQDINGVINSFISGENTITATGSTRADAYVIKKARTRFTTVAASTGALLPAALQGRYRVIYNAGASPLTVYAAGSDTIDGTAGSTGVALANAKRCEYYCVADGVWISAQLGVVSA
jgi:hypothetical protein